MGIRRRADRRGARKVKLKIESEKREEKKEEAKKAKRRCSSRAKTFGKTWGAEVDASSSWAGAIKLDSLAGLLQELPRPEAAEARLDPRGRRGLRLLPLPHQEASNAGLDLRRRLILERLARLLIL